jgi:hypothetical protein
MKLFKVKIFPNAAVHTKNVTLEGALFSKYYSKNMKLQWGQRSNLECQSFGRNPMDFIPGILSQFKRVQKTKEQSDRFHLPIMLWFGKNSIPVKIIIKKLHTIQ